MTALTDIVTWIRQPAYVGTNRCLPCTGINLGITVVVSLAVAFVVDGQIGLIAAALAGTVGTGLIYLRGYLIPGTPTLTKRYLPEPVLARFEKDGIEPTPLTEVDVERVLNEAAILEPCPTDDDLRLTPAFKRAWQRRIDELGSQPTLDENVSLFMKDAEWAEIDHETVDTRSDDEAYTVQVDGRQIAHWESKAAFVADCAAAELLADRVGNWERFGFSARTEVAGSLRLWLDRCPACGASVALGHDRVDSCCRSVDVISIRCEHCESRLFEIEYDPTSAEAVA